jgi:dimethylsulfone monooxygenase
LTGFALKRQIFITRPARADQERAWETLPAHITRIKGLARKYGRAVRTIINPHVIGRTTESAVRAAYTAILENEDSVAADSFVRTFASGDTAWARGHTRAHWG